MIFKDFMTRSGSMPDVTPEPPPTSGEDAIAVLSGG